LLLPGIGFARGVGEMHLKFPDRSLTLNFQAQDKLLKQAPEHFFQIGKFKLPVDFGGDLPVNMDLVETDFHTQVASGELESFFRASSLLRQQEHQAVKISFDEDKNVVFEGSPHDGFDIEYDRLVALINQAIERGDTHVRVPAEKIFSEVVVHPLLEKQGIQEIIAVGKSNFTGSSDARRQNILAATRKYNGLIISHERRFSFNTILESVKEEDGFVKELVIKGDKTEKELGGGVCQVSTTVFRAAFSGGLPIVNRRNHSYAVPYYQPFGLDATIYLGGQDFKFYNDTPGDILIQAFVEDDDLYFVFYGTDDGRDVVFEGPFISDYEKAPDPIVYETEDLPDGEMEVLSAAHDGFRAEWIRRVENGGAAEEEIFSSAYRAWPAKIRQGKEIIAQSARRTYE